MINLAEVPDVSYDLVPRGRYPGWVDDVEYGLSQSSDLPMLTWFLKYEYEEKERSIRFYTTLAGDGASRSKQTIARLDPELDLTTFAPEEAGEHFGDMEVMIAITINPDRNDRKVKRNNVSDIYPIED